MKSDFSNIYLSLVPENEQKGSELDLNYQFMTILMCSKLSAPGSWKTQIKNSSLKMKMASKNNGKEKGQDKEKRTSPLTTRKNNTKQQEKLS